MSYSDYFNVMCPLMCSEAVCDYFKKLGLLRQPDGDLVLGGGSSHVGASQKSCNSSLRLRF